MKNTADDHIISEEELLLMVKEAERAHKEGKTIKADSLADLLLLPDDL